MGFEQFTWYLIAIDCDRVLLTEKLKLWLIPEALNAYSKTCLLWFPPYQTF